MISPTRARLSRAALLALAGTTFSGVRAQTLSPAEIAPFMGMSHSRHMEIAQISQDAQETGDFDSGMTALKEIALSSRDEGDRASWLEAELEWVRLGGFAEKEGLEGLLQTLASRAREWKLPRQEADVYTYWAGRLEEEGHWQSALRAHDSASQAALGGGLINRGLDALLEMSRVCRIHQHPWRLEAVWQRISQIESELFASLEDDRLLALEDERVLALPMLPFALPQKPQRPRVDLQPPVSKVRVSKAHSELGRTKLYLTNETLQTVNGSLSLKAAGSGLKSWSAGESGQWLTLRPAPSIRTEETRPLSLRPGERLSLFIEHESPATTAGDSVSILWDSPGQKSPADITFFSAASQPEVSITNTSSFTVRPGWPLPLYQELNYRGPVDTEEDLQFSASIPCRLEIYDADTVHFPSVEAGKLIAVDAEGDGSFAGPDDRLDATHDLNGNGQPDIVIGDRSRSLELYAWPLREFLEGEEITITARHRRAGPVRRQPSEWQTDAENILRK